MRKKHNSKIYRNRIILIILTIVLGCLIITKVNGNIKIYNKEKNVNNNEDSNIKTLDNNISVKNNIYIARTGEIIELENFKIQLVNSTSENLLSINELGDVEFFIESEIASIKDDKIYISENAITLDEAKIYVNYNGLESDITIKIYNSLQDTINNDLIVIDPSRYDTISNKNRSLPENYVPNDLISITDLPTVLENPEVNQLRKDAYEALKKLFTAAYEEKQYKLYARSGYRSYNTQVGLYSSYVASHGKEEADKFSAKPGQSEHQTGLVMDITTKDVNYQLTKDFGMTEEGKWVAENAHRFGFIIRYLEGKEDITGYTYEPWHLRYVGEKIATEVYLNKMTLEEYFEKLEEEYKELMN